MIEIKCHDNYKRYYTLSTSKRYPDLYYCYSCGRHIDKESMQSHSCKAGVIDNQIYQGRDNYGWYYNFTGHETRGHCFWCGENVKGRYCSPQHKYLYLTFYHRNEAVINVYHRIYDPIRRAYICENCGKNNNDIHIHHIIPINNDNRNWNKRNTPDNLIGICKDCHKKIHSYKCIKAKEKNDTKRIPSSNLLHG